MPNLCGSLRNFGGLGEVSPSAPPKARPAARRPRLPLGASHQNVFRRGLRKARPRGGWRRHGTMVLQMLASIATVPSAIFASNVRGGIITRRVAMFGQANRMATQARPWHHKSKTKHGASLASRWFAAGSCRRLRRPAVMRAILFRNGPERNGERFRAGSAA